MLFAVEEEFKKTNFHVVKSIEAVYIVNKIQKSKWWKQHYGLTVQWPTSPPLTRSCNLQLAKQGFMTAPAVEIPGPPSKYRTAVGQIPPGGHVSPSVGYWTLDIYHALAHMHPHSDTRFLHDGLFVSNYLKLIGRFEGADMKASFKGRLMSVGVKTQSWNPDTIALREAKKEEEFQRQLRNIRNDAKELLKLLDEL